MPKFEGVVSTTIPHMVRVRVDASDAAEANRKMLEAAGTPLSPLLPMWDLAGEKQISGFREMDAEIEYFFQCQSCGHQWRVISDKKPKTMLCSHCPDTPEAKLYYAEPITRSG